MVTFNQQAGILGQQANSAVSDVAQNQNRAGFPNVKPGQATAKPMPITSYGPQRTPPQGGLGGMQRLPGPGPRTGPMFDPRMFGRPRGPVGGGNLPGVGGVNGVQPGAFGRIEKGAWNDPNNFRGAGGPRGPMGFPGGGLPRPPMGPPGGGATLGRPADPDFGAGITETPQSRQFMSDYYAGLNPNPADPRYQSGPNSGPFRLGQPGPQTPGAPGGGASPYNGQGRYGAGQGLEANPYGTPGNVVNRPQQPMAPPNNGGGPTPGTAGAAK